jgi:elongation factor G
VPHDRHQQDRRRQHRPERQLVEQVRERFGKQCLLLDLPTQHGQDVVELLGHDDGESDFASVAAAHRALIDQLVEEDDDLMARYLEDGTDPSPQELHAPFEKALRAGHLIPILFVSAKTGAGVPQLLDALAKLAPNPAEGNPPPFYRGEPDQEPQAFAAQPDDALHVLAHVFKVVVDPFIGKVGVFRVHQGTIRKERQLFAGSCQTAVQGGAPVPPARQGLRGGARAGAGRHWRGGQGGRNRV